MLKSKAISIIDNMILGCLIVYSLTFLIPMPINLLVTAFVLGLVKLFFVRPKIEIHSKHFYFLGLFIVCTMISVIFNENASFSEYRSYYMSPLVAILLIFLFELTKKKALILITLASTVFFINGIYVIYQFYIEGNVGRPVGFADGYMLLCGMNLLILPIIFTLSLSKKNIHKYLRWFFFLTIFINIPAIIFENTRIAWLALFFVFIISICYSIKEKIKKVFMIIFLIIYSLCCFQVSPSSVQRFETMSSTEYKIQSNYERILMWQSATNMFLDHPLIGVGIGNYHDEYINKYRSPLSREDQWHPHNVLLSMLSQTGIIGGLSYIILFTYLYYKSISDYKKTRNYITLAYISALTAFCINGLTDCNFVGHNLKEITYMFYFITGIYLILNKNVIINNKNKR
ncbi:O-antigen ligase family protein [Megamonas hypermegale]|uniref:O-antigen ligase family protein n=1 Tax=Megamonas hypermegale TaxID=158847 RepID=UPI002430E2A2|nr:O-antigen ligase family protein [Megamonas hypermegale]